VLSVYFANFTRIIGLNFKSFKLAAVDACRAGGAKGFINGRKEVGSTHCVQVPVFGDSSKDTARTRTTVADIGDPLLDITG
jgi:hypothetical protein